MPTTRDQLWEALRDAERGVRGIREVAQELRRVGREGQPYDGPRITWQSGNLGATRPEPHIALFRGYLDDNDIDVDADYLLSLQIAVAHEGGYRERVLDEQVARYDAAQN